MTAKGSHLQTPLNLKYSAKAGSTEVLGPGSRAAIWVHGCCFNCSGCLAESFKTGPYIEESADSIADWVLSLNDCCGLTISGGEPFLQAAALSEMIRIIRERKDLGVIIYTGFTYEELCSEAEDDISVAKLLSVTDILIDGRYVDELNDGVPYRGSANQRIIRLSDRYMNEMDYYEPEDGKRKMEIRVSPDSLMMIGIPDREQLDMWNALKEKGGFIWE